MSAQEILILPNFFEMRGLYRAYVTSSIAEYVLARGFLAAMPFVPSDIRDEDQMDLYTRDLLHAMAPRGIILQGGADICPSLYGQQHVSVDTLSPTIFRDYFERSALRWAVDHDVPVYGICRGMQMINVALGGTLHQDLPHDPWLLHIPEDQREHQVPELTPASVLTHDVTLVPGGVLSDVLPPTLTVNSYHHQGILDLAPVLRSEAVAQDALIEAVSWQEKGILGVQWHPELDFSREEYMAPMDLWLRWVSK